MSSARFWVAGIVLLGLTSPAWNQEANAVAARVNGQPIPEKMVRRGLKNLPPEKQKEARGEILNYLIANAAIDQYLMQTGVTVTPEESTARLDRLREEIKKKGNDYAKVLEFLGVTEIELKAEVAADLRWEKYCEKQATEPILKDIFSKNTDMFDGTLMRARHILLRKESNAPAASAARLREIKKQIEVAVQKDSAKLNAIADQQAREQARCQIVDNAFAAAARKDSSCPSKNEGGDLGWFPRSGSMVEPFARAAFALKPYEMSDVVETSFGSHLILATGRRPGKETTFEEVKDAVKELYCDRLRDHMTQQLVPRAQVEITPAK